MATSQVFLSFFLFLILTVICLSDAYRFDVGGKDGWVLNPTENYDHWAQRMRFSVNDTLYFKYKNGSDSVLVVNKDDYDKCNTLNPIMKLEGGDSEFKFNRSGPFYFITGNMGNCNKGQKLIVVVLAIRNPPVPSPSAGAPAPTASTPSPSTAPELSPMSPTPATETPVPAPALTPDLSPVSPSPESGPPSPPTAQPVSSPPSPLPPNSPSNSPPGSTVPTTGNAPPGGANSTAPAGSWANSFSPSVVLLTWVLFVSIAVLHGSF